MWQRDAKVLCEGKWYWVTDGHEVWPAVRDRHATGGWSNHDTWEDFGLDVKAWILIEKPSPPPAPVKLLGYPIVVDESMTTPEIEFGPLKLPPETKEGTDANIPDGE
jgi:hypothetical protein